MAAALATSTQTLCKGKGRTWRRILVCIMKILKSLFKRDFFPYFNLLSDSALFDDEDDDDDATLVLA